MEISCIHCQTEMQTLYFEGVAIQLCMDCKGVYLSERKLAIIEDSHETHDSKDALPRRRRTDKKPCPHCQTAMFKVRHGQTKPALIDFCEQCHGIWLDKGALASIEAVYTIAEERFPHERLRVA